MDDFLPSEVARLVLGKSIYIYVCSNYMLVMLLNMYFITYFNFTLCLLGYLKEVNCMKSWETFLQENPSLEEYCLLYKSGRIYCTNVDGKSLLEIFNLYRSLTSKNLI